MLRGRSTFNRIVVQAQEDVSKNLLLIKNMLYGTSDSEPQTDIVVAQLSQELYNSGLLVHLIQNLAKVDFEVNMPITVVHRTKSAKKWIFISFLDTGQKGCCSDIQQHIEEANWHEITYSRIHLYKARNPLHAGPRI